MTSQVIRGMVFIVSVLLVYALAGLLLLRMFLARRLGTSISRGDRIARRILFPLAVLGIFCIAYGLWIEPYSPRVEHVSLRSPWLRPGKSLRIVHISDLHSDPKPRLEPRLPELIAAQKPDLIVFTGDTINSPEGLPVAKPFLTHLAAIAPVYAVHGNWDRVLWHDLDLFGGTGVGSIDGDAVELMVRENSQRLLGGDERMGLSPRLIASVPHDRFNALLEHRPDDIESIARTGKIDLYCAGHTHGGQVALPWYGAIVTLSIFDKKYESGLYRVGKTWLYVTRGIGMEACASWPRRRSPSSILRTGDSRRLCGRLGTCLHVEYVLHVFYV